MKAQKSGLSLPFCLGYNVFSKHDNPNKKGVNNVIQEMIGQSVEPSGVDGIAGSYLELNPYKLVELVVRRCAAIGEDVGGDCRVRACILESFGIKNA